MKKLRGILGQRRKDRIRKSGQHIGKFIQGKVRVKKRHGHLVIAVPKLYAAMKKRVGDVKSAGIRKRAVGVIDKSDVKPYKPLGK